MKKNRKKLIIIGIILVVLMAIFYILNNRFGITKYAEDLNIPSDSKELIAIALLNNIEEAETQYKIEDAKVYEYNGGELYLIIPIYKNVSINVYSAVMEEADIVKDNLLYTTNKPFILKCNISDIIPNTVVDIKQNNKIYNYSPGLDLKDGGVHTNEYVLDITKE